LRRYLFDTVYMDERVRNNFIKAQKVIRDIYYYFCENPQKLKKYCGKTAIDYDSVERQVCDFIAGMTDFYAISMYEDIFLPKRWEGTLSKT